MKKLIKFTAMALSILALLSITACSGGKNTNSYWEVTRYEDSETGDPLTYYVELSVVRENPIDAIWVNVSNLEVDSTEITFFYGTISTASGKTEVKKTFLEDSDGWVKLTDDKTHSVSTVKITFVDTMQVNEIYVVDTEGNLTTLTLKSYGEKASNTSTSKNVYTAEELEALELDHTALCVVDEQDGFDLEEVEAIYQSAVNKNSQQIIEG